MMGQTPPPKTATSLRVLVIANPKSGQGDSGLDTFLDALRGAGCQVVSRELQPKQTVEQLLADAADFDRVVAAGGDGTVSSVAYALRNKNIPLLAYPAGTANLIALNLELPRDPAELAQIVLAGQSVTIDMGEVEVRGEKKGFCMLAGAGADAAMIRDSEDLKERFGAMAYVLSAMKQISPKKTVFYLVIDGQKREFEGIGVMVANFGRANYGLPITDDISPTDGHLTVILLNAGNLLRLGGNLIDSVRGKLGLGDPIFDDNLETIEAQEVSVDADEPFPLQYDGELHIEMTPFVARSLPRAVPFLTHIRREELDT